MLPEFGNWFFVRDGNPVAMELFKRHYSYQRTGSNNIHRKFVGPGEKMVLMTSDSRALFVWRKFIDHSGQKGVNCAVFRNESDILSSVLILEAEQMAWSRWENQRLYTYVNPRKIKSTNPGYCFLMAGWTRCGISKKRGYIILEKYPRQ